MIDGVESLLLGHHGLASLSSSSFCTAQQMTNLIWNFPLQENQGVGSAEMKALPLFLFLSLPLGALNSISRA